MNLFLSVSPRDSETPPLFLHALFLSQVLSRLYLSSYWPAIFFIKPLTLTYNDTG